MRRAAACPTCSPLKVSRLDVEDIGLLEGARIEHDNIRLTQIAVDPIEDAGDIGVARHIGCIRPDLRIGCGADQRIEFRLIAGDGRNLHALCGETPCQRPAQTGTYPENDRCLARWHVQITPSGQVKEARLQAPWHLSH